MHILQAQESEHKSTSQTCRGAHQYLAWCVTLQTLKIGVISWYRSWISKELASNSYKCVDTDVGKQSRKNKLKCLHFNFVSPFKKKNTVHERGSSSMIPSIPLSVWRKLLFVTAGFCKKLCCLMWLLVNWVQQHDQVIQIKGKLKGENGKNRNHPEIYVPPLFSFIISFSFWEVGFSEKHWAVPVLFKLWLAKCSSTMWQWHPAYILDWAGVAAFSISSNFVFWCFIFWVCQYISLAFSRLNSVPKHGVPVIFEYCPVNISK